MDSPDQGRARTHRSLFNPDSDVTYDFNVSGADSHAGCQKIHRIDPRAERDEAGEEDDVHDIVLGSEDLDRLKPKVSGYKGDEIAIDSEFRGHGRHAKNHVMANGGAKTLGKVSVKERYVKGMADDEALNDGEDHHKRVEITGKKQEKEEDDGIKSLKEKEETAKRQREEDEDDEEDEEDDEDEDEDEETSERASEEQKATTGDSRSKAETKFEEKAEEKEKAKFKPRQMIAKIKTKVKAKVTDMRK